MTNGTLAAVATVVDPNEYAVPQYKWDALKKKIDRLARKAVKLGMAPVALKIVRESDDEVKIYPRDGGPARKAWMHFFHVVIEGQAPKINGWEFLAVVNHVLMDDGQLDTVISTVPGAQVPEYFRGASPGWCDHCKVTRRRNDTFILTDGDNGYKRVGRTCLRDFLSDQQGRSVGVENMLARAEILIEAREVVKHAGDYGDGAGAAMLDLHEYLSWVAAQVRHHGWISRGEAYRQGHATQSTADQALHAMDYNPKHRDTEWLPEEQDRDLAQAAIDWVGEWVSNETAPNDYQYNLHVVTGRSILDYKHTGIAASAINAYQRELARKAQAAQPQASRHFGEKGEKATITVKVLSRQVLSGRFTTYLFKLVTVNGNNAVWFASNDVLKVGETVTLDVTIKDHKEFGGVKETVLTYCQRA